MQVKCPICRKITTWEENPNRPFCSDRCRLVDLGKWASEEYAVSESGGEGPTGEGKNA